MRLQFAHLEYDNNVFDWQGAELPFLGFDELTHFTERQFFYMMSRNRSTSGVPGYIRATTNPDSKSWVKKFIQWWINEKTGFAIPERAGKLRWFIRKEDALIWADTKEELVAKYGELSLPKSVTFIPANVYDNKILLEKDPAYLSNLMALPKIDREQLLGANWNITASAGMIFKRHWFSVVEAAPSNIVKLVRCWDRAATAVNENTPSHLDPDYTVGLLMGKLKDGRFIVLDIIRERLSSFNVEKLTLNTAKQDGINVKIKIFQDPGSAGVYESDSYMRLLAGFDVEREKIIKDKVTSAKPVSAQAEAGNILVLKAKWNEEFFTELENFPEVKHDDQVDAFSGAFNCLQSDIVGEWSSKYEIEETREILQW